MDAITPQTKTKFQSKQHDLEARLYALQKRMDDAFHEMAVVLASLYLEQEKKVEVDALEPQYRILDQIQEEIHEIVYLKKQPQVITPIEPIINTSQRNQTFTTTAFHGPSSKPTVLKLKVRNLEEVSHKKQHQVEEFVPSESSNAEILFRENEILSQDNFSIVGSQELLAHIEQKRLNSVQDSASIDEDLRQLDKAISHQKRFVPPEGGDYP
ncbi:MAG: hypothetical protein WCP97_05115 [bacterium]